MWHDLLFRIRALFLRRRMDSQMDDELRYHLDRETERNLTRGLSHDEAERRARSAVGPVTQIREECREARGVAWLESTLQDARYALRMLRKSPGFTLAVAASLALGIGANTAIFSLMDAVLWRSLPVRAPEELQLLGRKGPTWTSDGFTHRKFRFLEQNSQGFTRVAAWSPLRLAVTIDGALEPTVEGQMVSGGFFSTLGVTPAAGRTLSEVDDRAPNAHPVAMIGYGYWKRRFNLDPAAIGSTVSFSGTPFTIVGVAPPEFFGLEVGTAPDIFVPVMMQPVLMPSAENWLAHPINDADWLRVVARLKPRVSAPQAAAQLAALAPALQEGDLKEPGLAGEVLFLAPASRGISALRTQFSQPLFILLAVAGVVLLISCANTANLLLARAAARRGEWSVRLALGAGRGRLVRQMLVESLTLSLLGGVCGLLLARWATHLLVAFLSTGRSPIVLALQPDLRVLAFTAAVSIATGIVFGVAPSTRASRTNLQINTRGQSAQARTRRGLRSGKVLVVSQVALSLLLVTGAGLFVRSLRHLNAQDAGFARDTVVTVRLEPRGSDQRGLPGVSARLDRTYRDLQQQLESIHGVRAASLAHFAPTTRVGFSSGVRFESGQQASVSRFMVYSRYFETLGIPIVAGRDFAAADLGEHAPLVAVVNEAFARQFFGGANPVGRRYFTKPPRSYFTAAVADPMLPCQIIGLVKDSRYATLRGPTPPVIYQPFFQTNTGRGQMVLHIRTAGNAADVLPQIRQTIQRVDPSLPALDFRTLAAEVDAALIQERLLATLSGLFGALALVLACVGLYGLLAFASVQRTGEIGIRMALGARGGDVLWMILRDALLLTGAGIAIGVPAAMAAARLASSRISGLLFGLSATDPLTLGGAAVLLLAAGLMAAWLPARRASRVDPSTALRAE